MTHPVDILLAGIAHQLTDALSHCDNSDPAVLVQRAVSATRRVENAIALRRQLFDYETEHGVMHRSFMLIDAVEDYVSSHFDAQLLALLGERDALRQELDALRDQIDRSARQVLAVTHQSRCHEPGKTL